MLARLPVQARSLPNGWRDVPRQILLFGAAYVAYRAVGSLVGNDGTAAFQHAREVIQLERTLHVFVEPSIQAWASSSHLVMSLASWLYVNAQFTLTAAALGYVYLRHHRAYPHLRNMLLTSMAIAITAYAVFPTAPPRFLPEWGFVDSVSNATGLQLSHNSALFGDFVNPYAAVPSMHVAFALIIGGSLSRLVRTRLARALWMTYPLLIAFVIIATGNHFVLDTVLGALTAAVSHWAARRLARPHPSLPRLAPASTGISA